MSQNISEELQPAMNYGMRESSRSITIHDNDGVSRFRDEPQLLYRDRGGYAITRNYAVSNVPTNLADSKDINSYLTDDENSDSSYIHGGRRVVVANGLNFLTVDMGPGAKTPMHRTISIDFVAVIEGQIELELDSGEKKTLNRGDTIVQRATMHRWINPSTEKPARFIAVVSDAEKYQVAGKTLEQEYIPDSSG